MKRLISQCLLVVAVLAAAVSLVQAESWKFGLLSDTQWTGNPDDGQSPNTIPAGIMKQINQAFIMQDVKVVIDIGDSVDVSTTANLDARALYVQDLYNAGIGYFPLRGNHEGSDPNSGPEFARVWPQMGYNLNSGLGVVGPTTSAGLNNDTPADILLLDPTLGVDTLISPPAKTNFRTFLLGRDFHYPTSINNANGSVSYSFDYKNMRFVMLDQFEKTDSSTEVSSVPQQQPWISDVISPLSVTNSQGRAADLLHALVFSHKNLLGGNHKDNLFGANVNSSDPGDGAAGTPAGDAKRAAEDAFISALDQNAVHYYICGHDHHHIDSIVADPLNPAFWVHEIILQSDSSKFYTPVPPFSTNETSVSEDLYKIGYYIGTVDGPRVTLQYYAVDVTAQNDGWNAATGLISTTPILTGNWQLRLTFGYSHNGHEFRIPEGASYTTVSDSIAAGEAYGERYLGTSARILSGSNSSTATTHDGRALTKVVDTGWTPPTCDDVYSDILTLWGLVNTPGTTVTDTYALALSYKPGCVTPAEFKEGRVFLATRNASGRWVNAVSANTGGTANFVQGPFNSSYGLGTYGIDPSSKTAWAVVNHGGEFAIVGQECCEHGDHDGRDHDDKGHDGDER